MNSIHSAGGILALRSDERLAFLIRMLSILSNILVSFKHEFHQNVDFLFDVVRHIMIDPVDGKAEALEFEDVFDHEEFDNVRGGFGFGERSDKFGDGIVDDVPKVAFEDGATGGMIDVVDNFLVVFGEMDRGEETILEAVVVWWVVFEDFVDEAFDDRFEQVGDIVIMVVKSVAVNVAGLGDVGDADFT